jgi:hypothetical protein
LLIINRNGGIVSGIVRYEGAPFVARFGWYAGELMEKFVKSLAEKKLLATRCPKCGYTIVPPRIRCVKCYTKLGEENLVELSGKGKLLSYTVVHTIPDGKGGFTDLDKPVLLGAIKLDEADSTIFAVLGEVEPEKLVEGLEVQVVWREETKGELADIAYFKPVG